MDFRSNQRDHPKFNLLSTEMLELSGRSDFGTILCRAAEVRSRMSDVSSVPFTRSPDAWSLQGLPLTAEFLPAFSSAYQLSLPLQVALGLAFSHSIDERTRAEGSTVTLIDSVAVSHVDMLRLTHSRHQFCSSKAGGCARSIRTAPAGLRAARSGVLRAYGFRANSAATGQIPGAATESIP